MSFLKDLEALAANDQFRTLLATDSPPGPTVEIEGKKFLQFSGNDYLGLAADQRLIEVAKKALDFWGVGTSSSRLLAGTLRAHTDSERTFAQLLGSSSALFFGSGTAANLGVFPALSTNEDLILSDQFNHASMIDGMRLSRAKTIIYEHRNVAALEALLRQHRRQARRFFVATESIFSMEGSAAPLKEIWELCQTFDATLVVDEAHAIGVCGEKGRGLSHSEGLPLSSSQLIRIVPFGKALGSFGSAVLGGEEIISLLVNRARTMIFATALPVHLAESAAKALALCAEDPSLQRRLHENVRWFRNACRECGIPLYPEDPRAKGVPIQPVFLGDNQRALRAGQTLLERGILARAIRPPTVPEGTARLRLSITAAHQTEHLEQLVEGLAVIFQSQERKNL